MIFFTVSEIVIEAAKQIIRIRKCFDIKVTIYIDRKIHKITTSHQDRDVEKSAAGRERLNLLKWQGSAALKFWQASQGYLSHRIATKNPVVPVPKCKGVRGFSRPAFAQQQLTDNNKDVTWLLAIGPVLQLRTWPTYDQEKCRVQRYQILVFIQNHFDLTMILFIL